MSNGILPRRRELMLLLGAAPALAQTPAGPPPTGQPPAPATGDKMAKARDNVRRNSEKLAQMEVAIDTQPAFLFRP